MDAFKPVAVAVVAGAILLAAPSFGATRKPASHARHASSVETVIYAFKGGADGSRPSSGVIADASGTLYGTTEQGGKTGTGCNYGCGTVFRLTSSGSGYTKSTLYAFKYRAGVYPNALFRDSSGNLFGATTDGGGRCGCGTAFELVAGTGFHKNTLHKFRGHSDGAAPLTGLAADANGALYGTTAKGGSKNCAMGCGTVFKLTPSPSGFTKSVIFAFQGTPDGYTPYGNTLVFDNSGAIYGTTSNGGSQNDGTVFKLTPGPSGYTLHTIYSFLGSSDGRTPEMGVTAYAKGALYGATPYGGDPTCQCGIVFKLTPSGSSYVESIVYTFKGSTDGGTPEGGVVLAPSGTIYGTTVFGGNQNGNCSGLGCGVVYALTPSGSGYSQSVLYAFKDAKDGAYPEGSLLLDAMAGYLYGTGGGVGLGSGEVFRVTL